MGATEDDDAVDQVGRFFDLFEEAFDELHAAVTVKVQTPGKYVGPHSDYPSMSTLNSGFPVFSDMGFYRDKSPRDYVGATRPNKLAGLLAGFIQPEQDFPKGEALTKFLRDSRFAERLGLDNLDSSSWLVDSLVADAVERYLHVFGLQSEVVDNRRELIILPLVCGVVLNRLEMRLVVPIALTHFDIDHFKLTDSMYICRLPFRMQLARSRIAKHSSVAPQMVVGAATHAFVSKDWYIESNTRHTTRASLTTISQNTIDAADAFFAALRVATGISTGYAQIVWFPKKWALDYFCELPVLYGSNVRKYPSDFDDSGWNSARAWVTRDQLVEVRRVLRAVIENRSEAVAIALRRLNMCLTRTDAADALLDAIIGMEVLLGDDDNQSLSYKLRLRTGALAMLDADPDRTPARVAQMTKTVYAARSAVVHGLRKKGSKKATGSVDTRFEYEREVASQLLRFVIDTMLKHPEYLSPAAIDEKLLLRGEPVAGSGVEPALRKEGTAPDVASERTGSEIRVRRPRTRGRQKRGA